MNRSPSQKFSLLFEAAKRCLLASDLLLARLDSSLAALESDIDANVDIAERAALPLLDAVAFVDFAHRFGSIVDALPLISKKAPEIRELHLALSSVVKARNYLQHLRGDLSSNNEVRYPILGVLSWSRNDACYTVHFGQSSETDSYSIAFDLQEKRWAATYQFSIQSHTMDLEAIVKKMHETYSWFLTLVTASDPAILQLKWGQTQSFAFRMIPPADGV